MATHLDLEEQEQLDRLKHFWAAYGSLITWIVIIVLAAFAGWNGWKLYQGSQSSKAAAIHDEIDRAAKAGEVDRAVAAFALMKERYPKTAYAQQAGLLTAKLQFEKNKPDDARATLAWVGDNAVELEYRDLARVRLAGVLLDQKKYEDALRQLDGATSAPFAALVADRRGDVLLAQGKSDDAKTAYQRAWKTMDPKVGYRQVVAAKLTALGAAPESDSEGGKQ